MDDLWRLKWGSDNAAIFDVSLEYLGDQSLTAEVHQFREAGRIIAQYEEDIRRLETHKWEAGCLQDASIRRLKSANVLERLDRAQAEQHMQAVERANATVRCGRRS